MVFSFHSLLPLIYLVLEVPTVTETVEKELKEHTADKMETPVLL